jgi:hypothetical protein
MYPHEFIERVKTEYSNQENICQAAEYDEYELGKYLAYELFQTTQDAEAAERRRHLHKDWITMMAAKISSLDKSH